MKSKFASSLPLLQECWKQITGLEPKQDDDYAEVYCRDESSYILVNMVHDCFLRRFVKNRVETMYNNKTENESRMKMVNRLYRDIDKYSCEANYLFYNKYSTSFISEFVSCMDVEPNNYKRIHTMATKEGLVFQSAREYFKSLYKLEDPVIAKQGNRGYCQTDGTKKLSENIRCLKQRTGGNETTLNKCFKNITLTSPYPTSDDEIKSYLCDGDNKIPYPLAIMKKVELCVNEDLDLEDNDALCFTKQLLKKSGEDEYYEMLTRSSLEIIYYKHICLVKNITAFKEMIYGNFLPWYNGMICAAKKIKKESRGKSYVGKVIDYCWSYLMSHGQFINSTVSFIPNSDEEWMKFFCSHDYYNKRMALPSFESMHSCMERMLQLDSRSFSKLRVSRWDSESGVWIDDSIPLNPRRSKDEETLMRCLGISDFPEDWI